MTKKKLILLCAGLAAVVLLALAYFVLSGTESTPRDDETVNPPSQREYVVNGISKENLSTVTLYKNGELQYIIKKDTDLGEFFIEGLEHLAYTTGFESLISSVSGITVTEVIENPLPDDQYGITGNNSPYVLEFSALNGTVQRIFIGSPALSGSEFYCKKDGDTRILCVSSAISKYLVEKNSLVSKILTYPLDSSKYYYTESFELYRNMQKFISVEFVPQDQREQGTVLGAYRMTYPADYTPSDTNYDAVLKALISPEADVIVTTDITPENLEKYGFSVPSHEIYYTLDGQKRSIIFGNRTDDGLIYVLSVDFGFIGLAGIEKHFSFLDWDLVKFINPVLFSMNIDYISSIAVSGDGFSHRYSLKGKGEELVVRNADGAVVDTYNFRQFYRVFLMARMEGYADNKKTDNHVLSYTIETSGGKVYEYRFYQTSTRKCYYTLNGSGEFYVSVDVVNKILSDAQKLASGESVNAESQI